MTRANGIEGRFHRTQAERARHEKHRQRYGTGGVNPRRSIVMNWVAGGEREKPIEQIHQGKRGQVVDHLSGRRIEEHE